MRRFLRYGAVFVLILLVVSYALDYVVTTGLRKSEMFQYSEWNDIVGGKASADVIIQGSSRAWVGFSPSIIGGRLGMTCYNLGIDGYPLGMQLARYRLYRKYNEKPKLIVQSLDTYSLNNRSDLYQNNQFLPYLDEDAIREAVEPYEYFQWYDYRLPLVRYRGKIDLVGKGMAEFFGIHHYTNGKDRGYQGQERQWSDEFAKWVKQHPDGVDQVYLESLTEALDSFLAECEHDGIMVVLVYAPEYCQARDMVNNRDEILAVYRDLANKHGAEFLDYSYDAMANDTKYFYNSQHLNKMGSEVFSAKLAEGLSQVMQASGSRTTAGQ